MRYRDPAAPGRRDDDGNAGLAQGLGQMIGIVGAVSDQAGEAAVVEQPVGGGDIGSLTGREADVDDPSQCIDQGVDLGAQSTSGTAESLPIRGPPFAPAACWWARTIVLSIIRYSLFRSRVSAANTRSHTPLWAHRLNRR